MTVSEVNDTLVELLSADTGSGVLYDTIDSIYIETAIDDENIPIGHFTLDEISEDDNSTITLKGIDYMAQFEFNYDGSNLDYPVTLLEVLQDICNKAGVELGSTSFLNSDSEVSVYDNTVTARTYLSYISELAGGFAVIGRDGKLYIKTIGETTYELPIEYFGEFSWGEEFVVSRVAFEDGVQDFKIGTTDNNTIWLNSDNMYVTSKEQIQNIYDNCNVFSCYSFSGTSIIDPALDVGDLLLIDDRLVIYQGTLEYKGKFKASIDSDIQAKEKEDTTATTVSETTKLRRVQSWIDQEEGIIEQLVEESSEYSEQLANMTLTLESIVQEIEDVEDFTREKTQNHNLYIDNDLDGDNYIISFIVYGNTNLWTETSIRICVNEYPWGYGEAVYITNEDDEDILTEESEELIVGGGSYYVTYQDIELDDILRNLIVDGVEYFDTLEVAQDGTITVTRRIGVDSSGELYLLDEEVVTTYEETFVLPTSKDGYYYFIEGIKGLDYYAKYIVDSDYAEVLATKVEMYSTIEQTAESITLSVVKLLESYSTTEEMNSAISLSAETISLEVNAVVTETLLNYTTSADLTEILSNYTTSSDLSETLSDYTTTSDLTEALTNALVDYITTSDLSSTLLNYTTTTDLANALLEYMTTTDINEILVEYVTTTAMNSAITQSVSEIKSEVNETISESLSLYVTSSDLTDTLANYSTTTEMNSAITQSADSITSSVTIQITTALEDYTETSELGTWLTQNAEYIKLAWNQISQYIQIESLDDKASISIYDEDDDLLMTLNQDGQSFYDSDGNKIGSIGKITDDNSTYLAFSAEVDEANWEDDQIGMAWGFNLNDTFYSLLNMQFAVGDEYQGIFEIAGKLKVDGILGAELGVYTFAGEGYSFMDSSLETLYACINYDTTNSRIASSTTLYAPLLNAPAIELSASTPYIDFHYDSSSSDYTSRIIETSSGTLEIPGSLTVDGFLIAKNASSYTGYCVTGLSTDHIYHIYWSDTSLFFYVDGTYVGYVSDKRLKTDFAEIDDKFLNAIEELKIQQFKVDNRNGLISFGIIAQDLIEIFEKYEINPNDYEILGKAKYKLDDDTEYYKIEYTQFLILKQKAQDRKIKELQSKLDEQVQKNTELEERITKLEKLLESM